MRKVSADSFEVWKLFADFHGHIAATTTDIDERFDFIKSALKLKGNELPRESDIMFHKKSEHVVCTWG